MLCPAGMQSSQSGQTLDARSLDPCPEGGGGGGVAKDKLLSGVHKNCQGGQEFENTEE